MSTYSFRLAQPADEQAVIDFANKHWGENHPALNLPEYREYYYHGQNGKFNFVLAEQDGEIAAIAGFIKSSSEKNADAWLSIWLADKKASGSGLELMANVQKLADCRILSCNNIRSKTMPFYNFLGFHTGRIKHFYRLGETKDFKVAKISDSTRLPVSGTACLKRYSTQEELLNSGFEPPQNARPYKDMSYLVHRYFNFPHREYDVYGIMQEGQKNPEGLLVLRQDPAGGAVVIRIVDFLGKAELLQEAGNAINKLMQACGAEYADMYCVGINEKLMAAAGFCERTAESENIIPNYLDPPLCENTEYYFFTSDINNFCMFKADGDQDRPNIGN